MNIYSTKGRTTPTHCIGIIVDVAPFEEDHENQPTKDANQEEHLWDEFYKQVDVTLEVPVEQV